MFLLPDSLPERLDTTLSTTPWVPIGRPYLGWSFSMGTAISLPSQSTVCRCIQSQHSFFSREDSAMDKRRLFTIPSSAFWCPNSLLAGAMPAKAWESKRALSSCGWVAPQTMSVRLNGLLEVIEQLWKWPSSNSCQWARATTGLQLAAMSFVFNWACCTITHHRRLMLAIIALFYFIKDITAATEIVPIQENNQYQPRHLLGFLQYCQCSSWLLCQNNHILS